MPVRSLDGSVVRWPDAATVHQAAVAWTARLTAACPEVLRVGYIGSYARGDWGVGSDLDLVVVVSKPLPSSSLSRREWDTTGLPVPADLLLYPAPEYRALMASGARMATVLSKEAVWLAERDYPEAGIEPPASG
jgi:uncharacterized protein